MRDTQSRIFKIRPFIATTLLCILSVMPVYSASVQVFTYDEAMNEATISKPHIYVKNTGTTTLTDFDCYYYFTANGSEPILDNVNVTGAVLTVETLTSGYRLKFSVTNANIAPGNVFPDLLGWGIELHMLNNPIWNKGDDFSNNLSSSFAENHNVLVTSGGVTIYGNDPQSIPELEFVNTVTNISMSLTHDGYLNTKLDIHEHSSNPPVSALIFEQNGNVKLNVSDNGVGVSDEVRSHTITPPLDGDMEIANQLRFGDIPAAGIGSDLHSGTDGDLMLAQKILGQRSISVYVDGGVFERGSNGSLQVAYANIGNEGREFYEDGLPTERRNFYIKDHLGSTRMVVSDATTIVEATSYQPFGTMVPLAVTKPEEPVKEKFTGKEFDSEGGENGVGGIGLFYFGKRYYDAEVGRWISCDPVKENWSYYTAFNNNPIIFVDPDGRKNTIYIINKSNNPKLAVPRNNPFHKGLKKLFPGFTIRDAKEVKIGDLDPSDMWIELSSKTLAIGELGYIINRYKELPTDAKAFVGNGTSVNKAINIVAHELGHEAGLEDKPDAEDRRIMKSPVNAASEKELNEIWNSDRTFTPSEQMIIEDYRKK